MLVPVPAPPWMAATAALGAALRGGLYPPRAAAQAIGIIAWNGHQLDEQWWARPNHAEGAFGDRVELLLRAGTLPPDRARAALPSAAWDAGMIEEHPAGARLTGTIMPMEGDLLWSDTPRRAFSGDDGLFLPDSTTFALRCCLPTEPAARHLDLGSGGGAVAARAARFATETVAVDINPRAGPGCHRTAALSGVTIQPWTGGCEEAASLGAFDRVTFVLPLLVPWEGFGPAPVHTLAAETTLLRTVLELLPALLAPGGLAILYTQDHAGAASVRDTLAMAFGSRQWRGAFWWDYQGVTAAGPLRAGILAVLADRGRGWSDTPRPAYRVGDDGWWPGLEEALG